MQARSEKRGKADEAQEADSSGWTLAISLFMRTISTMHRKASTIEQLRGLQSIFAHHGVKDVWLFGSALRDGAVPNDIDLLVEFESPPTLTGFMGLKFSLEQKLQRPVDLHTKASCPERFMRRIQAELHHVA